MTTQEIIILIVYLVSLKKKKAINADAKQYYQNIILAVGGVNNILEVKAIASRLSLVLKDYKKIDDDKLKLAGIGIVKSTNKVTLVVGLMASEYANQIKLALPIKN